MTQCSQCKKWVTEYARIEEGRTFIPWCQTCAEKIDAWHAPFIHKEKYIGPPLPHPMKCPCGYQAVALCQGCNLGFCQSCWWKHSHTSTFLIQKAAS